MMLFEADVSVIAEIVFTSSKNTKQSVAANEIPDLIVVHRIYISSDGSMLLASGKPPEYVNNINKNISSPRQLKVDNKSCQWNEELSPSAVIAMISETRSKEIESLEIQIVEEADDDDPIEIFDEYSVNPLNDDVIFEIDQEDVHVDQLIQCSNTGNDEKWALQPFGWDDDEFVEYSEDEEDVPEVVVYYDPVIRLEDIPEGIKTAHGEYQCSACNDGKSFANVHRLWRHSEQHRQKASLCVYCGILCTNKKYRFIHERKCSYKGGNPVPPRGRNSFPSECVECGRKGLRSECEYYDHLNSHTGNQPYICVCGRSKSRHFAQFQFHRKKYNCPLEGSTIPDYANRAVQEHLHRLRCKQEKKTPKPANRQKKYYNGFVCEYCNRECPSSSTLARHRATHMERTIPCPQCNRLFATQTCLQKHIRTHLFARKCDLCGNIYKLGLAKHLRECHPDRHRKEGDIDPKSENPGRQKDSFDSEELFYDLEDLVVFDSDG